MEAATETKFGTKVA